MVDYSSSTEEKLETAAFVNIAHVVAGIYIWEFVTSLDFDWSYIVRKRTFHWPMIFYFLLRYGMLTNVVMVVIGVDLRIEVHCQALFTFLQISGTACGGLASLNLALRCIAIWKRKLYIVIPLVFLILCQWSLILHGQLLETVWVPGQGCAIVKVNVLILACNFFWSMGLDFIVMALTGYRLWRTTAWPTGIFGILFQDGLIYFLSAFFANLVAGVFQVLNLSPIMSIMFNCPAVIAAAIASTRAVRSLTLYTSNKNHIHFHSTPVQTSDLVFGGTVRTSAESFHFPMPPRMSRRLSRQAPGPTHIQIRMDRTCLWTVDCDAPVPEESQRKVTFELPRAQSDVHTLETMPSLDFECKTVEGDEVEPVEEDITKEPA